MLEVVELGLELGPIRFADATNPAGSIDRARFVGYDVVSSLGAHMDDFTARHLQAYAEANCYDDERNDFLLFVWTSDTDGLDYFKYVGWNVALNTFRRQQAAARQPQPRTTTIGSR